MSLFDDVRRALRIWWRRADFDDLVESHAELLVRNGFSPEKAPILAEAALYFVDIARPGRGIRFPEFVEALCCCAYRWEIEARRKCGAPPPGAGPDFVAD
jgi:hypothetical protein